MWNTPTEEELGKIPRLYETENIRLKDKVIHLHFFIMGSDWYIVEYDGTDLFWGSAILSGDEWNPETECRFRQPSGQSRVGSGYSRPCLRRRHAEIRGRG